MRREAMKRYFAFLAVVVVTAISASGEDHQPGVLSVPGRPGVTAAGNSFFSQFSADGRFIVFASHAKNLTTNRFLSFGLNVFRHELGTGQTLLVSASSDAATSGDNDSAFYSISSNGQFVAFASSAVNLAPNDTNSALDIFMRDLADGMTRLVTVNTSAEGSPPDPNPGSSQPLSSNREGFLQQKC